MPGQNKSLTIGLVILSAVMTFAAVTFYMGRSQEQAKRLYTESQLEEARRVKTALEKEKTALTQAKTELESKLQVLQGKVTSLEADAKLVAEQLAMEKRNAAAARDELASTKKQADDARTRLDSERREKLALADELAKAKQDAKQLNDELAQLRQAKDALEHRVKDVMTGDSSADTIVVTPSNQSINRGVISAAPNAPMGDGKVLVVNREFKFVVVNLGERDGVRAGQFLELSRSGRPVARVQVERVYDNMAAANMLPEAMKMEIKEGDQVRLS